MPAFRLPMKTVEERDSLGIFIKEDPPFDSLHSDLRWKVVLRFFRVERKACIAESYKDRKFKQHPFLTGFLIRRRSLLPGCPFLF
jgi:hypothetical protein